MRPVVAVTRAEDDAGTLSAALERVGAVVVRAPLIETATMDLAPLARALEAFPDAWIACTSRRAVHAVVRATRQASMMSGTRSMACVGAATAEAARAEGWDVALEPSVFDAQHVAWGIVAADGGAKRPVLFPASADAHDTLPEELKRAGYTVHEIPCYETRSVSGGAMLLTEHLRSESVQVITFASGSAVRSFAAQVPRVLWDRARYVSIGRTTASDAAASGVMISAVAASPTVDALAQAALEVANPSYTTSL